MSSDSTETGPAPFELAEKLHRQLAAELVRRVGAKPSAEVLAVARLFLTSCGAFGAAQTDKDRALLRRLWRLYLERLYAAITDPDRVPSASLFAEVRHALTANGINKDGGDFAQAETLEALRFSDLPFTH